jgi:uncharacterized protein YndB with AHSA1/START domain
MNKSTNNGKSTTIKQTFGRETSIGIDIHADPAIVWTLLTNAHDYARWNSTVISIEGDIRQGEQIKLKSTLDENRVFKLTVKEFVPEKRLIWGDRQGNRTYTITPNKSGVTFNMSEKIGGFMFPLYGRFIPSFDESFEQFAADLKSEAEIIHNSDN